MNLYESRCTSCKQYFSEYDGDYTGEGFICFSCEAALKEARDTVGDINDEEADA